MSMIESGTTNPLQQEPVSVSSSTTYQPIGLRGESTIHQHAEDMKTLSELTLSDIHYSVIEKLAEMPNLKVLTIEDTGDVNIKCMERLQKEKPNSTFFTTKRKW